MNNPDAARRGLLRALAAAATATTLAPTAARAQQWPSKPIRFVIPYPPGGASDVTARTLGAKLQEALGQSVVIENKPGANGIIALEHVARSPADGHTILMANLGPNAINPAVYAKLPYDAVKDFTPVMLTTLVPQVLVVNPQLPIRTVPELIAYAKQNPGKLNYASAGVGASNHLSAELFNSMAGVRMDHVAYKGDTPALTDVAAGTVGVMFPTAIAAAPHTKAGRLRAIAVTSGKRIPSMPDLPTVAESGVPGFEAVSWGGIMAPAGTPRAVVDRLHAEFAKILRMPDVSEKLQSLGAEVVASTPDEFGTYLREEIAKWTRVARSSNVKLD